MVGSNTHSRQGIGKTKPPPRKTLEDGSHNRRGNKHGLWKFRAHEHKLFYKAKIKKSQAVSKEITL